MIGGNGDWRLVSGGHGLDDARHNWFFFSVSGNWASRILGLVPKREGVF